MKKYLHIIVSLLLFSTFTFAQTAKINVDFMTSRLLAGVSYPAGTFPISAGINNVAVGATVYLSADTTGGVTSFEWSFTSTPANSATAFSSTTDQSVTFQPDMTGLYVVSLSVNGGASTAVDTVMVSTYQGLTPPTEGLGCGSCHADKYAEYKETGHAMVFKEGISGELETQIYNGQQVGAYASHCIKCHTTGWDQLADNGNFGYMAHQDGWDTTWYKSFDVSSGDFMIPTGDQTAWNMLTANEKHAGAITCEACHGPAADHVANFGGSAGNRHIVASYDAGVCVQCHDAPTHHMIGTYYLASKHATLPNSGHATSTSCMPCHSGTAYAKYVANPTDPGFDAADALTPVSCSVCHDPHDTNNDLGLRIPATVKLVNNYVVTTGGRGQICMTCHQSRHDIQAEITDQAPYYGFFDRFGPHHGPQSDMLLGQNAYQYGVEAYTGINTHGGLKDACVTCHMSELNHQPSHQFGMIDTTGGTPKDMVSACQECHGAGITTFDDIKASSDYDGNGKIEGVQTEVEGMLAKLADLLPKDDAGNVVSRMSDSLKVKDQPNVIKGIYTYYFVEEDKSMGVHNTKYTVAILNKALEALGSIVPVELTSFNASVEANAVTLTWETATETNNKGFEVERSVKGQWSTIGFVDGHGTSTEINKYSYTDKLENIDGKVTYRLKQIDLDGTAKYSKEVEVDVTSGPKEFTLSQNYPNPFNPSTVIKYSLPYESNIKLVIYNITGQVVSQIVNGVQQAGYHQATFNSNELGTNLSSGIYFYTIEASAVNGSGSFRQTKKMILMK